MLYLLRLLYVFKIILSHENEGYLHSTGKQLNSENGPMDEMTLSITDSGIICHYTKSAISFPKKSTEAVF